MDRLRAPTPPALSSTSAVSVLFGLALSGLGLWFAFLGARDASLVQWECAVSTCGTNDFAGAAPMLAVMVLILGGILLTRALRTVAAPLVVLAGAGAGLLGFRTAIDQNLVTVDSVRIWLTVLSLVAVLGLVLLIPAVVRELRRSSGYWVLLGRTATWGRVTDYQNTGGRMCRATVHFNDENGTRHTVTTDVPKDAFKRPPRVYYDPVSPTDLDRLRIGIPGQPLTASARQAQQSAIRQLIPLPGDDLHSGDRTTMDVGPDGTRTTTSVGPEGSKTTTVAPDGTRTVVTIGPDGSRTVRSSSSSTRTTTTSRSETITDVTVALERLSALHDAGALSDAEFAAAKAAILRR